MSLNTIPINIRETYLMRDTILKNRGYKSYQEYLQSEHWKNTKIKAKKKGGYSTCEYCRSNKNIQLHHSRYTWIFTKYELREVSALCAKCHEAIHYLTNKTSITLEKGGEVMDHYFRGHHTRCLYEINRDHLEILNQHFEADTHG